MIRDVHVSRACILTGMFLSAVGSWFFCNFNWLLAHGNSWVILLPLGFSVTGSVLFGIGLMETLYEFRRFR